ncbi:MAG: tetratricopeptide repeat protein [Thermostichus sp. BF3_bins_97]
MEAFCQGIKSLKTRNYTAFFQVFLSLAKEGNSEAFWLVGNAYRRGLGVEQDKTEALSYYRRGAELGERNAMVSLALTLLSGDCGVQNIQEAEELYFKLRNDGGRLLYPSPFDYLELFPFEGIEEEMDLSCFKHIKEAFNRKDYDLVFSEVQYLALAKDPSAKCILAHMLHWGLGTEKNDVEAVELLKQAAEQEFGLASYSLAEIYFAGDYGVGLDQAEGEKWFRRMRQQGYYPKSPSAHYIKYMLQREELEALEEKAKEGDSIAQCEVANYYLLGMGVCKNIELGLSWLKQSSAQGNGNASYYLATLLLLGEEGIPQNIAEAEKYYYLALEQGFSGDTRGLFSYLSN